MASTSRSSGETKWLISCILAVSFTLTSSFAIFPTDLPSLIVAIVYTIFGGAWLIWSMVIYRKVRAR